MQSQVMKLQIIRGAIQNHQQLFFTLDGFPREFCPHVLGTKQSEWHVFGWQFGGESKTGLPKGGDWRCLVLHDITTDIVARDGDWYRGWAMGKRGQSCIDTIDTVVDAAHAAEILSASPAHTPKA